MSAATITVAGVLDLLDGPFAAVADSVAEDGYALWLGSGISRGRVIGLDGVIAKLLEYLRGRSTPDSACRFTKALQEILDIAALPAADRNQIDLSKPVSDWPVRDAMINSLWNRYSEVLSVDVEGEKSDFLLWDALSFPDTFADQDPDVEHLAVAMLMLEGVASKVATANWDGLIEAGVEALGVSKDRLAITVTGGDLRQQPGPLATLYKFHGCALRAIEEEGAYRPLLVARSVQIMDWMHNDTFKVVRDQLTAVAQVSRTLMVGLSAQDRNIQDIFVSVGAQAGWSWDEPPSALVISASKLTLDQKNVLHLTYKAAWDGAKVDICGASLIEAYGRSLLPGLVLCILTKKLAALAADAYSPGFQAADRERLARGLVTLRNQVAAAGQSDLLAMMKTLASTIARTRHQIQNGESTVGAMDYFPLTPGPVAQIAGNAATKSTGQREAASVLGIVGDVVGAGDWKVSVDDPAAQDASAVVVSSGTAATKFYFAANDHVIGELLKAGAFSEDDTDTVVVCSSEATDRQSRAPSAKLRGLVSGAKFVSFGPLLAKAANADDLIVAFRMEVGL